MESALNPVNNLVVLSEREPIPGNAASVAITALRQYFARRQPEALPTAEWKPLHGGISQAATFLLRARWSNAQGDTKQFDCVAKVLSASDAREAAVYRHLERSGLSSLGPRLLHVHEQGQEVVLLLQRLRPQTRWPWRDQRNSAAVLERLAVLHRTVLVGPPVAGRDWCYERELSQNGAQLVDWIATPSRLELSRSLRRTAPAIRRLVDALPRLRQELERATGAVFIHGDAHPGNVMVCGKGGDAVLFDWGRARQGSALEDASSWLMSLGCWERGARQRHDTLLMGYLAARGARSHLTKELREAYWLAAASNALSGALLHHLHTLSSAAATPRARCDAERAAASWLRVLRRAHAVWR